MNTYAAEQLAYERMHDLRSAVALEQRLHRAHPSRTLAAAIRRLVAPLVRSARRPTPRTPRPSPSGRSG